MDKQKNSQLVMDSICKLILSCGGIGYLPFASGTFMSLLWSVVYYFFLNQPILLIIIVLFSWLGWILIPYGEVIWQEKDSSKIVIDELVGMSIAFLFIPKEIPFVFSAFLLFRFFDIFKIYPIDKIEEKKGPVGVIGDDVLAGIYTNLLLQLTIFVLRLCKIYG